MKSRTCRYCNRIGTDNDMVEYGDPIHPSPLLKVTYRQEYICAPETGCQKSYQHTWGGYLFTVFTLDLPLFIVCAALMLAVKYFIFAPFDRFQAGAEIIFQVRLLWTLVIAVIPLALGYLIGFPIFVSPILVIIFSFWFM